MLWLEDSVVKPAELELTNVRAGSMGRELRQAVETDKEAGRPESVTARAGSSTKAVKAGGKKKSRGHQY